MELPPTLVNIDPSSATTDELYTHGTIARIVGLEGHTHNSGFETESNLAIVVEGISRFRITQFRQRTPYIEADIEHFVDKPITLADTKTQALFSQVKTLSRELIFLLRMTGVRGAIGLPPMVAKRLELLIAKKEADEAGSLADFMVSAVETSLRERLDFLAAVDVPVRLEKAVTILNRQVDNIKNTTKRRNNNPITGPHLIVMDSRKPVAGLGGRGRGRRNVGFRSGGGDEEEEDENELEDLTKRLKEVGLSPEADKVAKREMARLKKMSPVQAEYGVCRTYLETLAEVRPLRVLINFIFTKYKTDPLVEDYRRPVGQLNLSPS